MAIYYRQLSDADPASINQASYSNVIYDDTTDEVKKISIGDLGPRITPVVYSSVKAYKSTPQTIPNNDLTVVTFDNTTHPFGLDANNEWTHTGVDSHFTPVATGWYSVFARISFESASWAAGDGSRLRFVKGTDQADTILDNNDTHGAAATHAVSKVITSVAYLIAGNQFRFYIILVPTTSKNINGDSIGQYSFVNIYRLF